MHAFYIIHVWYIDTFYINTHCILVNPLVDREMKVYYVTHVLKQGILKYQNGRYVLTTTNTKSHVLQVYLGAWAKIESAIENESVEFEVVCVSSAILVHIIECQVVVQIVATFKILKLYLKLRVTTFNVYRIMCIVLINHFLILTH